MDIIESFEKKITSKNIERWRYPRFFTLNIGETAVISGEDATHISAVLRMKKGDKAIICDNSCNDYLCSLLTADKNIAEFKILKKQKNNAEPSVYVRLFQCMTKNDKFEFIIQKATELGASEIVPVISARCVSRPDSKSETKKLERYLKISKEAAKQSGRGKIPLISEFTTFKNALNMFKKENLGIIFYECGGQNLSQILPAKKTNFDIFIGCEGGFEENEIEAAKVSGISICTLGERILRCETAPISALSILMNLTGNM